MKNTKYVLGVLLILGGLGGLIKGSILGSLLLAILGSLLLPPINELVKSKFTFFHNKQIRYTIYIALFLVSAGLINKTDSLYNKKNALAKTDDSIEKENVETASKLNNLFETCDYGGEKSYIIPDMNAADVYVNFENKGFKIDKQIEGGNTSIYFELSSTTTKYIVIVTGCSPEEIIEIEATADDYSGNNQNEVENFLGYVTTLQYKNSEPEKARGWLRENIDIDGAKTTIGGVTFSIHFKTSHSKFLRIEIEK